MYSKRLDTIRQTSLCNFISFFFLMNSILTGQIDLTKIQESVGIWMRQIQEFAAGKGVAAIENFIQYKITLNIFWEIIWLIFLILGIVFALQSKRWYKQRKLREGSRYSSPDDFPRQLIGCIISFVVATFIITLVTDALLGRTLAPEITFIQYFTSNH